MQSALVIPDVHRPYFDKRAWDLVMQVGSYLRPTWIVTLGDFGDFYCTSRHPKDPSRSRDLDYEVDDCNVGLDDLDSLGAKHNTFLGGNHEDNLRRYLQERAPELSKLVKVEELFRLKQRGWKYVPYQEYHQIGKIYFTHEVGYCGAAAHAKSQAAFGSNLIIGHNHRLEVSYTGSVRGERFLASSLGWLGDAKKAEYMHKAKKTNQWQLGFGVINFEPGGIGFLQACPIVNYRTVVNGKQFK